MVPDEYMLPKRMGLYVDLPFLRHKKNRWEMNALGKLLDRFFRSISPWLSCSVHSGCAGAVSKIDPIFLKTKNPGVNRGFPFKSSIPQKRGFKMRSLFRQLNGCVVIRTVPPLDAKENRVTGFVTLNCLL